MLCIEFVFLRNPSCKNCDVLALGKDLSFLRATACNAIARLCYGRGVIPSVCLSVCPSHCCIWSCGSSDLSLKYTGDRPRQPTYEIKLMLSRVP